MRKAYAPIGGAVLACMAGAVAAQTAESEVGGEVVIVGRLEETLPQELARYGNRVETVTSKQIRDGGYNDVSQTLQSLSPGFYVAPRAGAFDYVDLSFQGSRTGDVLWLIDGVRLNNRLYNTTTPIDTIPAHLVERIEVLEGGQGLFYGTQAVAGAVNIVTRNFSDTPEGALSLGLDTNDGRHLNGYFRSTVGAHQFVVYGSHDEADGFRPFREQDYQPSATDRERGYDVDTVGVKYGYNITPALRVSALYQHTGAELDHVQQPKAVASAVNDRDEDIASIKLDYTPGDAFQLFLKGYHHIWDVHFSRTDTNLAAPGTPIVISDREFWGFEDYGINALAKLALHEGLEYFVGYDFQRYSGQDDVLLIARRAESVHAPFAQIRTTSALFPHLRLAAGVRHNSPDNGESATVWNASGHWDISPSLFMRASVGTAFRLPDAYELFAIDPCCEMGNPSLEPEESENLNVSLGGELALGGAEVSWEAIGFFRDVTNLISITFDPALGVDTFENTDRTVKVRGGELVMGAAFATGVSLEGSFTYTDAKISGSSLQMQDIPETLLKVAVDYAPTGRPFGASLTVSRVGDVFRNFGAVREEFGNYAVVDLSARLFLGEGRRHRLGVRLENAFDEEYASRVRQTTPDGGGPSYTFWYLGTPRTLHATYTYSF